MLEKSNIQMIEEIKNVIISSGNKIAYEVNNTMLLAHWNVGRIIVEKTIGIILCKSKKEVAMNIL